MKILFYLAFCIIDFILMFYPDKIFNIQKLKIWHAAIPFVIIFIIFFVIGIIGKIFHIQWHKDLLNITIGFTVCSIFLGILMIIRKVIPEVLETIINFHKIHNSQNLHKNPVKFFIENQKKIEIGFYVAFFLASISINYGGFFAKK